LRSRPKRERHISGTPRSLAGGIVREDEVVGAKDRAELGAKAEARRPVFSQTVDGSRVEANPARRVRLRVLLDQLARPVLDDRSFDEQRALVEIDVPPSQRAEFPASRARRCRETKETAERTVVLIGVRDEPRDGFRIGWRDFVARLAGVKRSPRD
jgi:hypothetical protein